MKTVTIFDDVETNRLRVALARVSRQLDQRATQDGMTRTQLTTLGSISRAKRLPMSELAESEGINPTMLSRIVGKLEEMGYAKRVPDQSDRRAVWVQITAAGSRAHERARKVRTELLAQRLAQLSPDDANALLRALPALEALSLKEPATTNVLSAVSAGEKR